MLRVALTGGLASGKSEALRAFERCGAWTLSLDELSRELSRKGGAAYRSIVRAFGRGVLGPDGEIARAALAARVFGSPRRPWRFWKPGTARKRRAPYPRGLERLEQATHPHILREMRRRLGLCRGPVAVVDAPLLFEGGLERGFDASVLVSAPAALRLRRALRRGLSRSSALSRMRAQWPQARKEALADVRIRNDGSLNDLRRAVRERYAALRLIAQSHQGDR